MAGSFKDYANWNNRGGNKAFAPQLPGMKKPTIATGPFMDNGMGDGGGTSYGPTGPSGTTMGGPDGGDVRAAPQPPRLPPIQPPQGGWESSYSGPSGYATTPQTQNPALSAPYSAGTPTPEQRPPYSADPPPTDQVKYMEWAQNQPQQPWVSSPDDGTRAYANSADVAGPSMTSAQTTAQWGAPQSVSNPMGGYGANTGIVPPGTGGIKPAPGYSPPPYDPSTDPLAQGGSVPLSSLAGGSQFGGIVGGATAPYNPVMTAPGSGIDHPDRVRITSGDRRAMREALQDPALKAERQARTLEILKNNPNFANDPRMMQLYRQETLQNLQRSNPGIAGNANFNKVNKARTFTPEEIAAYNAAKGMK